MLDDIRIRDFILNPPDKLVSELMDNRVVALQAYDDQETASEVFKMNNRVALPVVSSSNKLLGIVTIDDMLWVAGEEFSEDMQKMGGTAALEEPYIEIPLFKLYKKRIIWLIILFFGELITISAMQQFQDEMAHRRSLMKSRNDYDLGCPLCWAPPVVTPAARPTQQQGNQ